MSGNRLLRPLRRALARFWRGRGGAAAVEGALVTPVLLIGLVAMVDIGLATSRLMVVNQSVRAGADFAMDNPNDLAEVERAVYRAAGASAEDSSPEALSVAATRSCQCPGSTAGVNCFNLCTDGEPPSVFVDVVASRAYQALLLPDFSIGSRLQVQTR